jgi:glycosyltransferase involved in cell wall biosynthesis
LRFGIESPALHVQSGYGIQARYLAERLTADGHQVTVFAISGVGGGDLNIMGVPHYSPGRLGYNADVLDRHVGRAGCDVLLTLCDLAHQDTNMITRILESGVQVLHWVPVDCAPLSVILEAVLRYGGGQPVAMSRFGERMLRDRKFDPPYVPHSVDTRTFTPFMPATRAMLREETGVAGKFAVGVCAANADLNRKGFFQMYRAFAAFHADHPDSVLVLHSPLDGQFDHLNQIQLLGLEKAVKPTDDYPIKVGLLDAHYMAAWMNSVDVAMMPSWGEGFGVPAIEFQACGVPVIATDCSALTELVQPGIGWRVAGEEQEQPLHKRVMVAPRIDLLTRALGKAYGAWKRGGAAWQARQEKARAFAVAYDADVVYGAYWRPVLKRLEGGEWKAPVDSQAKA